MSRDYCFTAWREPEFDKDKCRYVCWGRERCPTTDREHYQGFIIFNRTCRIPGGKRILGGGDDAHFEPRRGTRQQARDYCRKDGEFTEWGVFDGMTKEELFRAPISLIKNQYPEFYCRYHKGLEKLQTKGDMWRDVKVNYIWGESGTGKTRRVMGLESVYKIDPPYKWWDGYEGEEILLIDDYKKGVIERGTLLNLLDGYRLRLETKGGHTWALWKEVYITSNFSPERLLLDKAFERRITNIVEM